MAKYALFYYGEPQFDKPEDGAKHQQRFMDWAKGLGAALINPGTPLGNAKTVTASGATDANGRDRLTGFSVVTADSLDDAIEIAMGCPFVEFGSIDVAEVMVMKG